MVLEVLYEMDRTRQEIIDEIKNRFDVEVPWTSMYKILSTIGDWAAKPSGNAKQFVGDGMITKYNEKPPYKGKGRPKVYYKVL